MGAGFDVQSVMGDSSMKGNDRVELMKLLARALGVSGGEGTSAPATTMPDSRSAAATAAGTAPGEQSSSATASTSQVGGGGLKAKSPRYLELEKAYDSEMKRSPLFDRDRADRNKRAAMLMQAMGQEAGLSQAEDSSAQSWKGLGISETNSATANRNSTRKQAFSPVQTRTGRYISPVFDPATGKVETQDLGQDAPVPFEVSNGAIIKPDAQGNPVASMFSPTSIGAHGTVFHNPDGTTRTVAPLATPKGSGGSSADGHNITSAVINGFNAAWSQDREGEYVNDLSQYGLFNPPPGKGGSAPTQGTPGPASIEFERDPATGQLRRVK